MILINVLVKTVNKRSALWRVASKEPSCSFTSPDPCSVMVLWTSLHCFNKLKEMWKPADIKFIENRRPRWLELNHFKNLGHRAFCLAIIIDLLNYWTNKSLNYFKFKLELPLVSLTIKDGNMYPVSLWTAMVHNVIGSGLSLYHHLQFSLIQFYLIW